MTCSSNHNQTLTVVLPYIRMARTDIMEDCVEEYLDNPGNKFKCKIKGCKGRIQ